MEGLEAEFYVLSAHVRDTYDVVMTALLTTNF